MLADQVRAAAAGVILESGARPVVHGPEGHGSRGAPRRRRIAMAGIAASADGLEGTAGGVMGVAVEAIGRRMRGLRNTRLVVVRLGVADLAEAQVGRGIDPLRGTVVVG